MNQDEKMNPDTIREKFGDDYIADEQTFIMGIDQRFTSHFADRFKGRTVLETCTGAGFTTISLARSAKHVFTIEINTSHQEQAIRNVKKAGLSHHVSFIHGSVLDQRILEKLPSIDAAFIDPDWAVTGPDHIYRFINSNTQPPADKVLEKTLALTKNVALVLPPSIDTEELGSLPEHEREKLYLEDERHELFCLYFGALVENYGETEFHVPV